MRIEFNPRSLQNLENICEVLYKLHPHVLDTLIDIERKFGKVLGKIDMQNLSKEEREFLANLNEAEDYSMEDNDVDLSELLKEKKNDESKDLKSYKFNNLRKYLQLDTYEYIPIKIYLEVEDPVIGRKVKELVEALEKTHAPEQFFFCKKEMDEDAYFAEGYRLTMNEEQKKKLNDFLEGEDLESLKELLIKEKLCVF